MNFVHALLVEIVINPDRFRCQTFFRYMYLYEYMLFLRLTNYGVSGPSRVFDHFDDAKQTLDDTSAMRTKSPLFGTHRRCKEILFGALIVLREASTLAFHVEKNFLQLRSSI